MLPSRENQQKLQFQQQGQINGGTVLKNIFGIYARHPMLSLFFVTAYALFTSALFELLYEDRSLPSYRRAVCIAIFAFVTLLATYATVRMLQRRLVALKPIAEKKVLITLVSADKRRIADTASYQVIDAMLYTNSKQARRNYLEEVIFITTEDISTQTIAEELVQYVKDGGREGTVYTIAVNEKYPDEIARQMSFIFSSVLNKYKTIDVVADYTGGTKNMSIALYSLAVESSINYVYLYPAKKAE